MVKLTLAAFDRVRRYPAGLLRGKPVSIACGGLRAQLVEGLISTRPTMFTRLWAMTGLPS